MHRRRRRSALAGGVLWALVSFASTARAEPQNACVATCEGADSARARTTVAILVEPTLQSIRSCLVESGKGDGVRPIVLATIEGTGGARTVHVTQIVAGGQEHLACMPKITHVERPGAVGMLCDLSCDGSAPRPHAPAPATPAPAGDWPPASTGPKRQLWYGWQTLILDGIALPLVGGGIAAADGDRLGAVVGLGAIVYLTGPPTIHFVHGRVAHGFGSFGIRLLAPPIVGLIGGFTGLVLAVLGDERSGVRNDWAEAGLVVGALIGWGASVAFDAAVLSYEDKSEPVRDPQALRVRPSLVLAPTPHGGFLGTGGLTGTF